MSTISNSTELKTIYSKLVNFDDKTFKPVKFSWSTSTGRRITTIYDDPSVSWGDPNKYVNGKVRSYEGSDTAWYFIFDEKTNSIWCKEIYLTGIKSRKTIREAHWTPREGYYYRYNLIYQIDADKHVHYYKVDDKHDGNPTIAYYGTQASLPSMKMAAQKAEYMKKIFSKLFGDTLCVRHYVVSDDNIERQDWVFYEFIRLKGRKMSAKTRKDVDEMMKLIGEKPKTDSENGEDVRCAYGSYRSFHKMVLDVTPEDNIFYISHFSEGKEFAREYTYKKTGKVIMLNYQNGEWNRATKSKYESCDKFDITERALASKNFQYVKKYIAECKEFCEDKSNNTRSFNGVSAYRFTQRIIKDSLLEQALAIAPLSLKEFLYKNEGDLQRAFYKLPKSVKGNVYQRLGVNRQQFAKWRTARAIKMTMQSTDISDMDEETFEALHKVHAQTWVDDSNTWNDDKSAFYYYNYQLQRIVDFLRTANALTYKNLLILMKNVAEDDKIREMNSAYSRYSWKSRTSEYVNLYVDYIRSYTALVNGDLDVRSFSIIPNLENMQDHHDRAAAMVTLAKQRIDEAKWAKARTRLEKFAYTDEEYTKYAIVAPKEASDIVHEGSVLGHCVGGYVSSVSNGNTNILFLRKTNDIDTPWGTIEVRKKYSSDELEVVQIHLSHNRWLGSEDESFAAVPFVAKWLEKNKIQCTKSILTSKASGYSCGREFRALPEELKSNKYII